MARAAVLVPCQSDSAEVLPEDVSADEVLQVCMHIFAPTSVLRLTSGLVLNRICAPFKGPLLSAKLNDCRSLHWSAASSNFQVCQRLLTVVLLLSNNVRHNVHFCRSMRLQLLRWAS